MKTTWVLVADEAIARILELPQEGGDLVPVEELADADAHASEAEMRRAPHGRRSAGGALVNSATVSASDSERHQHAQVFAGRVAQHLAERRREGRYDLLHMLAAPRFLGYLRKALDPAVASCVASEQDKDVVQESPAQLMQRLPAGVRP
ncbi:MAG: host attachment protein [Rubrivivax sp.]|nr:MAG: host attachment protein [Rubrivivax sp.]